MSKQGAGKRSGKLGYDESMGGTTVQAIPTVRRSVPQMHWGAILAKKLVGISFFSLKVGLGNRMLRKQLEMVLRTSTSLNPKINKIRCISFYLSNQMGIRMVTGNPTVAPLDHLIR